MGSGFWDYWPSRNKWGRKQQDLQQVVNYCRGKNLEHACLGLIGKSEYYVEQLQKGKDKINVAAIMVEAVPSQGMRYKLYVKQQSRQLNCFKPRVEDDGFITYKASSENGSSSRSSNDQYTERSLQVFNSPSIKVHCYEDGLRYKNYQLILRDQTRSRSIRSVSRETSGFVVPSSANLNNLNLSKVNKEQLKVEPAIQPTYPVSVGIQ